MNIPELVGMGLIRQPQTLQEYLRKKQIKEEAERAAKESAQRIFSNISNQVRGEHENNSVHNQRSLRHH
ncbi:hypothetical protein [Acinetobacter venetianus]|uniref:hypothetical protein n=1 Tax=Acinetobacter venetianus TaxID=52133 RepID=UPI0021503CEB|nr:hypothetical protein [Acinetobacter venetianus]MCR4530023.1 hypothetical protein [Acinetobacter venetianus]